MLRWMPMAVADLAAEWFESEPLRATIAAGGILGSFLGPRSAGSAAILLMLGAGDGQPVGSGWSVAGGPGALADALAAAARHAGVEIRTNAEVGRIVAADRSAIRRDARPRVRRSPRASSFQAPIQNVRCSGLLDPIHLAPEMVRRVQNIRAPRHPREDQLRGVRAAAISRRRGASRRRTLRMRCPAASGWRATSTASSARSTPRNTAASPTSRGSS